MRDGEARLEAASPGRAGGRGREGDPPPGGKGEFETRREADTELESIRAVKTSITSRELEERAAREGLEPATWTPEEKTNNGEEGTKDEARTGDKRDAKSFSLATFCAPSCLKSSVFRSASMPAANTGAEADPSDAISRARAGRGARAGTRRASTT